MQYNLLPLKRCKYAIDATHGTKSMMLLRRTTTAAIRRISQRRHLGYVELERDVVAPQHLAEYRAMLAAHAP